MTGIAVVLLSGGMDSTTCLYHAVNERDKGVYDDVLALSINYGQRHKKELDYAKVSCQKLKVPFKIVQVQGVFPSSMLTDKNRDIPDVSYDEISGVSPTYVPYRNGTLLSVATAFTVGASEDWEEKNERYLSSYPDRVEHALFYGAHAEDAANWAYPDCTPEFNGAVANAIYIGTYHKVRLHTPLQWMTKDRIVRYGEELGVDWRDTWSCYDGGDLHCGKCPTCRARKDAFRKAGVTDPTEYAD